MVVRLSRSSNCAKFLFFGWFYRWKNINLTPLEDPGDYQKTRVGQANRRDALSLKHLVRRVAVVTRPGPVEVRSGTEKDADRTSGAAGALRLVANYP